MSIEILFKNCSLVNKTFCFQFKKKRNNDYTRISYSEKICLYFGDPLLCGGNNRFNMSALNKDKTCQEDEYLIILHKDELSNDKELEEAIKLNSNGNYYMFQRSEFLGDPVDFHRFSKLLLEKVNLIKAYIKISDINLPFNSIKLKEMTNELLYLIDLNLIHKKVSVIEEIKNFGLLITSNLGNSIKSIKVNMEREKKIQKSIDFIYWLLKKNIGLYYTENESEIDIESKDLLPQVDSQVSFGPKTVCNACSDREFNEKVLFSEDKVNKSIIGSVKDENNFNFEVKSLSSAIESEEPSSEIGSDFIENTGNMDDVESEISQRSEPIIKNRMNKLHRKAGTVIVGNEPTKVLNKKLEKDKYLKLIECCKSLTKTAEIKENISTNNH